MNILIVNMSVDPVLGGGTVERTRQLAKELQKLPDTKAKVLSTTAGLNDKATLEDDQFILLPCLSQRWYIPTPSFGTVYQSVKWADAVIIIGHWTLINAMVYVVNKVIKRPCLFCPAGALHIFGRSGMIKRIYNTVVGNSILKGASRVVAIPHEERNLFCKLGVPRKKTAVIPNGISPEDFLCSDTKSFRINNAIGNFPFLLFMGRLNEIKGPDILLCSFMRLAINLPEWHLVFAGPDGGMGKILKKDVKEYGLESRVHFIGFVSGEEKSKAYHAAEILVVPSRLEAMSIVALEAGICATPVVMTDQCGFTELVDAGGGLEVPVSVTSLADTLSHLMEDRQRIQEMGMKAKIFINKNYTWEIAAKAHRQLCIDVCVDKS